MRREWVFGFLDVYRIELLIRVHEFVSDLNKQSKGHVRLLHAGKYFGLIDVAAGKQLFHHAIGGLLHVVNFCDSTNHETRERITTNRILIF